MDEKISYKILQFAEDHDGYVSVAEAKRFGIAQTYLVLAEEEGRFEKVAKGLYVKKGYPIDPYYITHFRYPKIIFHLLSAAFLHGWISKEESKTMMVKCPKNYMTSGITSCACMHVNNEDYRLGIALALTENGQFVPITDKERTLVDFLKYSNRFEPALVRKVIQNAAQSNIDWDMFMSYAKTLRQESNAALLEILYKD